MCCRMCTCNNICSPHRAACPLLPLLTPHVPQHPSWRWGLAGALWSAKKKKCSAVFKPDKSVDVATVREYLTSGVLYSSTSQLGGKEQARKKGSKERHAYLSLSCALQETLFGGVWITCYEVGKNAASGTPQASSLFTKETCLAGCMFSVASECKFACWGVLGAI